MSTLFSLHVELQTMTVPCLSVHPTVSSSRLHRLSHLAACTSSQTRQRLFRTNFPFTISVNPPRCLGMPTSPTCAPSVTMLFEPSYLMSLDVRFCCSCPHCLLGAVPCHRTFFELSLTSTSLRRHRLRFFILWVVHSEFCRIRVGPRGFQQILRLL